VLYPLSYGRGWLEVLSVACPYRFAPLPHGQEAKALFPYPAPRLFHGGYRSNALTLAR
jgi:hypothetical protein